MIQFQRGDLFDASAEAFVNTVNTVGVMGKGIALLFKQRFPENFRAYAEACDKGEVQVGQMFVTTSPELEGPRWIVNFPTKKHWRQPTKIEWVKDGLVALSDFIREKDVRSIAIPALGCGNGGLNWSDVRPLIENAFVDFPEIEVLVFEPSIGEGSR